MGRKEAGRKRTAARARDPAADVGEHGLSAYPDFQSVSHFGMHAMSATGGNAAGTLPAKAASLQVSSAMS